MLVGAAIVTAFFCVSGAGRRLGRHGYDDTFTLPAALGMFFVKAIAAVRPAERAARGRLAGPARARPSRSSPARCCGASSSCGGSWTRQLYYVPPPAPPAVTRTGARDRPGKPADTRLIGPLRWPRTPPHAGTLGPDLRVLPSARGSGADTGWAVTGTMISGMAVWGGAGWLLDRWLDIAVFFPVGIILGMAVAIYLVVKQVRRADPATGRAAHAAPRADDGAGAPRTQKGQR